MDDIRIEFLFTLYFIGRKVKSHYKQENKDLMLTAAILHVLQNREYTLSELAKQLHSKLSSLSEKITSLQEEGLIQKTGKHEDEREQFLTLTDSGKKHIKKTLGIMKLHCIEFTKELTQEELIQITPLLKKLSI